MVYFCPSALSQGHSQFTLTFYTQVWPTLHLIYLSCSYPHRGGAEAASALSCPVLGTQGCTVSHNSFQATWNQVNLPSWQVVLYPPDKGSHNTDICPLIITHETDMSRLPPGCSVSLADVQSTLLFWEVNGGNTVVRISMLTWFFLFSCNQKWPLLSCIHSWSCLHLPCLWISERQSGFVNILNRRKLWLINEETKEWIPLGRIIPDQGLKKCNF